MSLQLQAVNVKTNGRNGRSKQVVSSARRVRSGQPVDILHDLVDNLTTHRKDLTAADVDTLMQAAAQELIDRGALWRDEETGEPYVRYNTKISNLDPDDLVTRMALHEWCYANPSTSVYRFIVEDLAIRARKEAPTLRISHWQEYRDGKLYISCGQDHLVRVDGNGIHKLENGADDMWFASDSCYPEWSPADPVDPTALPAFRPSLSTPPEAPQYTPESQVRLAIAWMIAKLAGYEQLPLLVVKGGRGSGKTELSRAILRTLDPHDTVQDAPSDQRDMGARLANRSAIALDNMDEDTPGWLKDQLARAVTGMRLEQRRLYTNFSVAQAVPRAGIIISSRTTAWARPDVAERSVVLNAAPMTGKRIDDETLRDMVVHNRDGLLSYLALTAWKVRQLAPQAPELPGRFVNFSRVAWAFGQLIGWNALPALKGAVTIQSVIAADSDPILQALLEHWDDISFGSTWSGTPSELVKQLSEAGARLPYYGGGKAVASVLRELQPIMQQVGFMMTERRQGNNTIFSLSRVDGGDDDPDHTPTSGRHAEQDGACLALLASGTGESGDSGDLLSLGHTQYTHIEEDNAKTPESPESPIDNNSGPTSSDQGAALLSRATPSKTASSSPAMESCSRSVEDGGGSDEEDDAADPFSSFSQQIAEARAVLIEMLRGGPMHGSKLLNEFPYDYDTGEPTLEAVRGAMRELLSEGLVQRDKNGMYSLVRAELHPTIDV